MHLDATNTIDLTAVIFIKRKHSVIKKTPNPSYQDLLLKTASLVLIHSNMSTIKETIKQTTTLVHSGKTVLTKTGTVRNSRSSGKVKFLHITE